MKTIGNMKLVWPEKQHQQNQGPPRNACVCVMSVGGYICVSFKGEQDVPLPNFLSSSVILIFDVYFRSMVERSDLPLTWGKSPKPPKRRRRRTPMNPRSLCLPMRCSFVILRLPSRAKIQMLPLVKSLKLWLQCGMV